MARYRLIPTVEQAVVLAEQRGHALYVWNLAVGAKQVPAAYTSQRCAVCGHVALGNRRSQAVFECQACNKGPCNADVNAARNIAAGRAVTARGDLGASRSANREPQLCSPAAQVVGGTGLESSGHSQRRTSIRCLVSPPPPRRPLAGGFAVQHCLLPHDPSNSSDAPVPSSACWAAARCRSRWVRAIAGQSCCRVS
jgi:hypothetical protein